MARALLLLCCVQVNTRRRCSADGQRLWRFHSAPALCQLHSLPQGCAARYPSPAHSARHPLMRRLLGAQLCECGSQTRPRGGAAAAAAGEDDRPAQPYGGALVLPLGCSGACDRSSDPFQTLDRVPAAAALPHDVVEAGRTEEAARVLEPQR